jgi:thiol-disulfide isomerase/thioredoxin
MAAKPKETRQLRRLHGQEKNALPEFKENARSRRREAAASRVEYFALVAAFRMSIASLQLTKEALSRPQIRAARIIVFGFLLFCALTTCACARLEKCDSEATPVLSKAPETTYPLPPLKGKDMGWVLSGSTNAQKHDPPRGKISDYRGRVLVLDLYATWCEPCRESIPHLIALQRSYGEQGLQIIGLNVGGPDDRVKVADFAREFGIQYPLGFPDKSFEEFLLSDNESIPQTFVFDRKGEAVKRFIGYGEATADELEQTIRRVIENDVNREP